MRIDLVQGVFLASTRDRAEGATLKALGGWRWHSGACDARFCRPGCPATGLTGWWTTDASTAARATGDGVHTDASLAAIEAARSAPKPAKRAASVGFDRVRGIFVISDADKAEAQAIRNASGGDKRWRWHSGECNPEYCRKGCPAKGHTGWWTTDVALVRPLRLFWADSLRVEMERREDSAVLSRATSDACAAELPCPAGKAYLPFQAAGIRYAMGRQNALIADEMGLGKTVQAVGTVNADTAARRVLVICPAFLREVWRRHAEEWSTRKTRVVVLETASDVAKAAKSDALTQREDETLWVVISYGGCRTASAVGKLLHPSAFAKAIDVLVLDECHRTKEPSAQQSKGAIALAQNAKRVLALTGTPVLNRPIELATTLQMLDKGFNFWRFAKKFCGAHETRFGWDFSGSTNEAELQRELRETVMIRRLKADVLKELPSKSWSVVALDSSAVPAELKRAMPTDKAARAAAMRAIANATGDREAVRAAIEAELTEAEAAFEGMSRARAELGTYKVSATVEYVSGLPSDECVLIFAHHKPVARAIFAALGGEKCGVYLDGDVPAADRVDLVDQFQASTDPSFRFVVATIESAKEGLTITRCSRVIFAEQAWTPGTMSQAEDRAHRIGQTRGVQVDYLVFDGTLDAYLCKLLAEKARISQAVLDNEVELPDTQNAVVLDERAQAPKPTASFDAHDPAAYVRRVGAAASGESREDYARRTAQRRGVTTAYQPTESEIAAVLAGMRALAGDDEDRASKKNDVGFAKSDVYVGHAMAQLDTLTPELWALGAALCRKYRGQLGDALVEATGVARV